MTFDEWAESEGISDAGTDFRESYRNAWEAGANAERDRLEGSAKDPWMHAGNGDIIDANGDDVACAYLRSDDVAEDIASRIVACVNACAGMSDPAREIAEIRSRPTSNVIPININDDAIEMLRNALMKKYAFVLCIEIGEKGLGKVCTHNRDDELVAARMLERFARWNREIGGS